MKHVQDQLYEMANYLNVLYIWFALVYSWLHLNMHFVYNVICFHFVLVALLPDRYLI